MTDAVAGHVVVKSRAIEKVFIALSATTLGVTPGTVTVRISDDRGRVRAEIRAPYADRSASVLDAAAEVQNVVRTEGGVITGAEIGTVAVRITDVIPAPRRRLA